MILLQIKAINQVKAKKWESKDLSGLKDGQSFVRFVGDHPDNPESGSIVLSTQKISGQFDDIIEVLFVGDDVQNGKLINHKKRLFGGYNVEIQFDTIYGHGLKYSAHNFIQPGSVLIGLTEIEKESLSSIETQRMLLSLLAGFIIPKQKDLIVNLARVGFLCIPNDGNDSARSYYLGKPNHNLSEIKDRSGNDLYHLATLNLEEFKQDQNLLNSPDRISFYIKENDTENGWPEEKGDFKVIIGKSNSENLDTYSYDQAINMSVKPILDLPGYDHALISHHKFSDDDINRFDALRSVFKQLIMGDEEEEVNKFLGYPDNVQNCVSYEAERIFNNREYSEEIYQDAINWCLLLQVSPYCKWFRFFDEFGDGTIYYMIRKQDLELGDFSKCQVVVQNT